MKTYNMLFKFAGRRRTLSRRKIYTKVIFETLQKYTITYLALEPNVENKKDRKVNHSSTGLAVSLFANTVLSNIISSVYCIASIQASSDHMIIQ
jgi:hypothetical protein